MRSLTLVLVIALSLSAFAGDDEQRVKADLKEATVYLTSAKLSITTQAQIPVGPSTVIIENLPSSVNPESIQLNAKGEFVILSVQYANNYLKELKKNKQAEKLTDSLERLTDKMEILNGKSTVLEKEEAMVEKNGALSGTQTGFKVEDLAKLADFFRKRLGQITEEKIKLKQSKKELQKQIDQVAAQLNELNQPMNMASGEIRVSVTSKVAVAATFTCDFLVYNAGWEPMYDLRAKNTSSPIQLNFKAKVYQNTGMDWKNVKLSLSTTNPMLGGNKPELYPWYLDLYQPRPILYRKQDMMMKSAAGAPAPAMEEADRTMEAQAQVAANYTSVAQTTLAAEYEISIPYTIPSSGRQEVVEIQQYSVAAFYQHGCVPKMDNDAFLLAGLTGWEKLNLLPGNSNIYFENSYIGQAYIDPQNTSDTLYVSLGRDKKVVVKRENVKDYTSKKVIGTTKKDEYGYEITIRNTKTEGINIEVEDQLPISKNSEIEVEVLDKGDGRYDAETGKLVWKLKINPSETKKLRFRFSVKYPKNKQVSGL